MSIWSKVSIIFVLAFATVFSNACKNSFFGAQETAKPEIKTEEKPQLAPITPVIADGRTSYADIVDRVAIAVVKVSVEHKEKAQKMTQQIPFPFPGMPQLPNGGDGQPEAPQIERGVGSGVIISSDGTILTNHHVVDGATKIKIEMNDKRILDAKVVGSDELSDLAVLKVDAKDLPAMTVGDSSKVRVGDVVLAIGNPLGIGQTVTSGIISAKGRATGLGDGHFEDFLQTDAAINRGNSGGALINLSGELIGINSQILSPSGGSIGIGFAIPSNMAKTVMEQLVADGKVSRGMLGVGIQNITADNAEQFGVKELRGAVVNSVQKGSAAEKAGIKVGDVITSVNGEKIDDGNALRNRVSSGKPKSEIALTILRDSKEMEVKAMLDEFKLPSAKFNGNPNGGDSQGNSEESGKLGLSVVPFDEKLAERLKVSPDTKGLVVTEIDPQGAAASAGIAKGDVITQVNRQDVESVEDFKAALEKGGNKILLLVNRHGQTIFVTVETE